MIMGVSYFVIPLFVRKYPFSDRLVTLHFLTANVGLLGMVFSFAVENYSLLSFFSLIEVFSVYLFLFNIISTAVKGAEVEHDPPEWAFLTMKTDEETDRWATRFTQAATNYFIIGCTFGGYIVLSSTGWSYLKVHFHVNLLGWVTMMIYGVAYHIFPRFSGRLVKSVPLVKTNFIIANTGLLLMIAALIYAEKGNSAILTSYLTALAGAIEGIAGIIFVYNILPVVSTAAGTMGRASVRFVQASLSYLVLGVLVGVAMALKPDLVDSIMPVHAHLNVLGWITMMIFGVGYYIIPSFAGKKLFSQRLASLHFWLANVSLIGFLALYPFREEAGIVVGLFALAELFGVLIFIYNITRSILFEDR